MKRLMILLLVCVLFVGGAFAQEAEEYTPRVWTEEELAVMQEQLEWNVQFEGHRLPEAEEVQLPEALAAAQAVVRTDYDVSEEMMAAYLPEASFILLDDENNRDMPSRYTGYAWLIAFDVEGTEERPYTGDDRLSIYVHPETGEVIDVIVGSVG